MTAAERIKHLTNLLDEKEARELQEQSEKQIAIDNKVNEIKKLYDRIDDLTKVIIHCVNNKIDIDEFKASGIKHNLGYTLVRKVNGKNQIVLAIFAGGYCGLWGLEVSFQIADDDSKVLEIVEKHDEKNYLSNKELRETGYGNYVRYPENETYLCEFLREYENFEKRFYDYIDNLKI